jgi:nicotinamidase-related amidase
MCAAQRLHVAGTDPYPWPFDGEVVGRNLALVICGAQRSLIDASAGADDVTTRLDDLARDVRESGGSVVMVRHGHRQGLTRPTASLPLRNSSGWQLGIGVHDGDLVVDSAGWDGCFGSDLDHSLRSRGLRAVLLAGFASEITVDSTVRTLNDRGHECLVLTDACAPLDVGLGTRAHASLTMSGGIFGALGTTVAVHDLLHQLRLTACLPHTDPKENTL